MKSFILSRLVLVGVFLLFSSLLEAQTVTINSGNPYDFSQTPSPSCEGIHFVTVDYTGPSNGYTRVVSNNTDIEIRPEGKTSFTGDEVLSQNFGSGSFYVELKYVGSSPNTFNYAAAVTVTHDFFGSNVSDDLDILGNAIIQPFKEFIVGLGDWNTAANWCPGGVPTSTDTVLIPAGNSVNIGGVAGADADLVTVEAGAFVKQSSNTTFTDLKVEASGGYRLDGGKTLNISDSLLIHDGAFFNANGNVSGGVRIAEMNISSAGDAYNIGLPFGGLAQTPAAIFGPFPGDARMFEWSEGTDSWSSAPEGASNLTAQGKGYAYRSNLARTIQIQGNSFNSADVVRTVTNNGSSGKRGFNLLGNPYLTDYDLAGPLDPKDTANILPTVWVREYASPAGTFLSYNMSSQIGDPIDVISPMQGFWIRVDTTKPSGTFTFRFNNKIDQQSVARKSAKHRKRKAKKDYGIVYLETPSFDYQDRVHIYFNRAGRDGLEKADSEKRLSTDTAFAQVVTFAKQSNNPLHINTLSPINDTAKTYEVALGILIPKAGTYTFHVDNLSSFGPNATVKLIDEKLDQEHELTADSNYSFSSSVVDKNDVDYTRFSLLIRKGDTNQVVTTTKKRLEEGVELFSVGSRITVQQIKDTYYGGRIALYNTMGQRVYLNDLKAERLSEYTTSLPKGVYVVELSNNKGQRFTKKVVLE